MKLLMDLGNTRWKWAISEGGALKHSGVVPSRGFDALNQLRRDEVFSASITSILVSSVASPCMNDDLIRWCREVFSLEPRFAYVKKTFAELVVAYDDVSKLGVDRWLAMLAARERTVGDVVMIDAGSALTVDFVNASGLHEGGLILPGLGIMRQSLFDKTAAVKIEAFNELPSKWEPGRDTFACFSNGVAAMLKGFLSEVVQVAEDVSIVVTGGDGDVVSSMLARKCCLCPQLVLEGLIYVDP